MPSLVRATINPYAYNEWFTGDELPIDITISPDDLVAAFERAFDLWDDTDTDDLRSAIADWRSAITALEERYLKPGSIK
jgi:hypothetical protein